MNAAPGVHAPSDMPATTIFNSRGRIVKLATPPRQRHRTKAMILEF